MKGEKRNFFFYSTCEPLIDNSRTPCYMNFYLNVCVFVLQNIQCLNWLCS
jgi:hypothetical protein